MHLEKKIPQPKCRMTTLESGKIISKIWAFLYPRLVKSDERNIDWPKFMTSRLILFINSHSDHPLMNRSLKC